jgi:3-oxo-5-alpha-steroid 4-dehydrogenase 1
MESASASRIRQPSASYILDRSLSSPVAYLSFRLHSTRPSITVSVIAMGAVFNVGNGYLNGRYLFTLGPECSLLAARSRFILGALLFWSGYALNQHSDRVLIGLRTAGTTATRSPTEGDIGT